MIVGINYASYQYRPAQKLNTKYALKYGMDEVIEYSRGDISQEFISRNKKIFSGDRGDGYWLWKPYIIRDALSKLQEGDLLVYTDAGTVLIKPISLLIEAMEKDKMDVMCFASPYPELYWSKRDAFIIMGCEDMKYYCSPQIIATAIILKKTEKNTRLVEEYLTYCCDERIVTDSPSELEKEFPDFIQNRYDQTVWSLLCKKNNISPYLDPSQYGSKGNRIFFSNSINERSQYPQVFLFHKRAYIQYMFQAKAFQMMSGVPKMWKYFAKISCSLFHIQYSKNVDVNYKQKWKKHMK